jgi:methionyl-tRNA formyltransferase
MTKKVVFFGSIGIAKKILDELVLTRDLELVGVCCEPLTHSWRTEETVYDFCRTNRIPFLEDEDIIAAQPDLGISVRYNRIIRQPVIDSFKMGIVNTHGGILPEYRGSYCNINALINNEKEYGVTLHYIDSGVDSGDIVAIKKTLIKEQDTGFDLYKISESFCYDLMAENIDALLAGNNPRIPQEEYIAQGHVCNEYKAKKTLELKCINPAELQSDKALRIIRAFDSDSHEPAYTYIDRQKVYLRVKYE